MKALCVALVSLSALLTAPVFAQSDSNSVENDRPAKRHVGKGMTMNEVQAIIGQPREVKAIEVEGARGESWIYRRIAKRVVNQVAPTTQKVPAWGGPGVNVANGEIIEVDVPLARNERVTIYQFTALLFVDGKVVASKQWFERESLFD